MLRSVPYAEADIVATLFSQSLGVISILARGARNFRRGAPIQLEPLHTLRLELAERQGAELLSLRSAIIATARRTLTADLDRMQAAGRALRWLRRALPQRTPEPEIWSEVTRLLDALDTGAETPSAQMLLAEFGINLVGTLGYALNLGSCVVCARSCEQGRSAFVDVARGGIVCRHCGGAGLLLPGSTRERIAAAARGLTGVMLEQDALVTLDLVDHALHAHVGIELDPPSLSPVRPSNPPPSKP